MRSHPGGHPDVRQLDRDQFRGGDPVAGRRAKAASSEATDLSARRSLLGTINRYVYHSYYRPYYYDRPYYYRPAPYYGYAPYYTPAYFR